MKRNRKRLLYIILVVIVLALAQIIYLIFPKDNNFGEYANKLEKLNKLTLQKTEIPKDWIKLTSKYHQIYVPNNWHCEILNSEPGHFTSSDSIRCFVKYPPADGQDSNFSIGLEDKSYTETINAFSKQVLNELNLVPQYRSTIQEVDLPSGVKGFLVGNYCLFMYHDSLTNSICFEGVNEETLNILSTFSFVN